jgi:hypothetical protein
MLSSSNNPSTNILVAGVTEEAVVEAVTKSGYPLQLQIADLMRKRFEPKGGYSYGVVEEWSYIHKDSGEIRTIDIMAQKWLWTMSEGQPIVRPNLALLVECKQSDMPHIFFLSSSKPWMPNFPLLAGLRSNHVTISTDDTPERWTLPIFSALGVDRHPFINEPEHCVSFARCQRKSQRLELSGEHVFRDILLPVLRAMQHFRKEESPAETAHYLDCHLTLGIAVLDAPMIGVKVSDQGQVLTLMPWVRALRHETGEALDYFASRLYVVDIVHKDFFESYLDEHVFAFAEDVSRLVKKHQEVIATGEAFVSRFLKGYKLEDLEQGLQPSTRRKATRRE